MRSLDARNSCLFRAIYFRNKAFFGAVTLQEFLGEWDKFDFRLVNEKDVNGFESYEIEGRLKAQAQFHHRAAHGSFPWRHVSACRDAGVRSDRQELRTFRVTEYHSFGDRAVVGRMEIENLIFKTTVVVEVLNMMFPDKLRDDLFTRESSSR